MAEEGIRVNESSSGLALLLSSDGRRENTQKSHVFSYLDDVGNQSLGQTLEHIFDLPHKSVPVLPSSSVDAGFIRSILKKQLPMFESCSVSDRSVRDGVMIMDCGSGPSGVLIDNATICGDIRAVRDPLLVESFAVFSSARVNACVWNGKWMYEVTLETAGIQQLGWAAMSCPFTPHKGVGDVEDSYAFDGKMVSKWNREAMVYGQSWVAGDVIGCCIDLVSDEISFCRNGVSLGVAFNGIPKMCPGIGYCPAISLSEGERCDLNFGSRPFAYPIKGFDPIQAPPSSRAFVAYLFQCLARLLLARRLDRFDGTYFEKLRNLMRFANIEELFSPISHGICEELLSVVTEHGMQEYTAWGSFQSFLLQLFGAQVPHDFNSVDRVINLFLEFPLSGPLLQHAIVALSCSCKIAPMVLMECPYSGPYPYLALACHILRRSELMVLLWKSTDFEFAMEGFLSKKSPNRQDLQSMMPSVWFPGSCEDIGSESSMMLSTMALSGALDKIEELHRELCLLVIHFIPYVDMLQSPGSVFWTFLQNFILKVRRADHKMTTSVAPGNSVLVSLYTVILHILSEGFQIEDIFRSQTGSRTHDVAQDGFLHRSGLRSFPISLFFKEDSYSSGFSRLGGPIDHLEKSHSFKDAEEEEICWDEGCMEDEDTKVTHSSPQKPCCCSTSDIDISRLSKDNIRYAPRNLRGSCSSISERSVQVKTECNAGSLNDEIVHKSGSSDQPDTDFGCRSMHQLKNFSITSQLSSGTLREVEFLDIMLFLYHLGVAPNFRQAFYYMSQQSQLISLLDETDKQIREKSCAEQVKRLKEARIVYRDELVDCIRQCAWYRISLFSRWKQRGMYATCMWVVQLLSVLSDTYPQTTFLYVPEFYLESLVDGFHALRKSDPPFVSSSAFIKQGLAPFITFIVKHFNDPRIASLDIKDLLLQSISVLVQCKDYLVAFESNKEAVQRMPKELLLSFDNRSWIPVTNILVHLCKGGFGYTKQMECSASTRFQGLIRGVFSLEDEFFSSFLNRLFNTLSWTMTEFSVSIREMQESHRISEMQQRKCGVIFDLSCNLARLLEFCTREISQAFLVGADLNLRRLTELVIFILNHVLSVADAEFFDMALRRPGLYHEKISRTSSILAPVVGIILNLMDASAEPADDVNDIYAVFASMDCSTTVHCGIQYLLGYNWGGTLKGDASLAKLAQLEEFANYLRSRTEAATGWNPTWSAAGISGVDAVEEDESNCCICYARVSDAVFEPCGHKSCTGCITRHLLNSQRCFFCNAMVTCVAEKTERRKDCRAVRGS